ncbi:major facilitator superfamily MFS_1 [Sphingobium chlorophenolicum L-1]|uniref:Major facilitator superfamily MFS_1 n=1 Tax=Sphingobium chlorophenolicum L-1 TaxID=690566 RepID=F6F2N7_SPHCR|nr:MFS transporter [Sphingobium chlorophenolicum]AEG50699.1 major facilitator superfamily MFS_1 [Sphingobium chlorophenolicum L-1]
MSTVSIPASAPVAKPAGRYRWVIVALLFAACTINYIDRQMIGILKPILTKELGWSESDYADIVFYFQLAYAAAYLLFGKIVDTLGARLGYAVAVIIWTAGHMAHGMASTTIQFALARAGLGIGEAGNFPGGIKAVTEWFPKQERAFATGLFNAGANVGAILTPLLLWIIIDQWGLSWRMAFYLTGIFGVLWLIAWWTLYRRPEEKSQVGAEELAWIQQDRDTSTVQKIPLARLITRRETWAYALGKFFIDPIWWFFLFWLPGYLGDRYGLDLKTFALPVAAIYVISDLGSIAGGWLSSRLIARGHSVNFARKMTMLACALVILPIWFAQDVSTVWGAVLLIGLATAGHQAFSANLYTLPSDVFPQGAVGTVIGFGGTVGAVGGMCMAKFTGYILDATHSYETLFAIAASAYLVALLFIHLLSPRLEPVS